MGSVYWFCRNWHPASVNRFFSKGQLLSAALYSIGHGANDAQKTMGIIMAVLIASGIFLGCGTFPGQFANSLDHFNLPFGHGGGHSAWRMAYCEDNGDENR